MGTAQARLCPPYAPISTLGTKIAIEHALDAVGVALFDVPAGLEVIAEDRCAHTTFAPKLLAQVRHARFIAPALLAQIIIRSIHREPVQPWLKNLRGPELIERIVQSEENLLGDVLTIKGERKEDREVKRENYIRREISYGALERRIGLPKGVDTSKIKAAAHHGIIEITIPLHAEAAQPKKINVEVATTEKTNPKLNK